MKASSRIVKPEILDRLAPEDPAARRSRGDLRAINALMGNFRWVEGVLQGKPPKNGIVEIGAGEGVLSKQLVKRFPEVPITALDLAAKPIGLEGVEWKQGDLFSILPEISCDALVGVMIVHHFSDVQIGELGRILKNFRMIGFCEPWRSNLSRALGGAMLPFVGAVTRHDMMVSIDAGFRPGELPGLLGLDAGWSVQESRDWRGGLRLLAWRD